MLSLLALLLFSSIIILIAYLISKIMKWIRGVRSIESTKLNASSDLPKPFTPEKLIVRIQPDEKRVKAATEIVTIPTGVTITVRRSRTVEHTVDISWRTSTEANANVGLYQVLAASIRGEVERIQGRAYQQSETTEYQVELSGSSSNRYRLTWTDIWLTGVVETSNASAHQLIPFQFRERAELEVQPLEISA